MEVVSASPLRVGSIVWQPRPSTFVLTIACKATFALAQFESLLAPEQDDLHEADGHWNDDESRSLSIATDLAPFKRRADILLTGSAFAPAGTRVRALTARMRVHGIDKAIEVVSDHVWTREGELREGAPFAKMPLRWERAAGGPGTVNPVGVRVGPSIEPDARGVFPAPNLLPPGTRLGLPTHLVGPVGFAPIAPSWPERAAKLNRHAPGWDHRTFAARPLPEDVDGAYFNAAPPDQQVPSLPPDPRIVLEHLHPEHPMLTTSLARVDPRAFVERARGTAEITLRPDTLWIDTDRMICTLVWRGQLPLDHAHEAGRVVVSASLGQAWTGDIAARFGADASPIDTLPATGTLAVRGGAGPVLPFQSPVAIHAATPPSPAQQAPSPGLVQQAPSPGLVQQASSPGLVQQAPSPGPAQQAPSPAPGGKPGIAGLSVTMPLSGELAEPLPFKPGDSPLAGPDSARPPEPHHRETGTLNVLARRPPPPVPFGGNAFSQTLPDLSAPAEAPRFDPAPFRPTVESPPTGLASPVVPETPHFKPASPAVPATPRPEPAVPAIAATPEVEDPSLEACAAIAASIGRRPAERRSILDGAGLSTERWERVNGRWEAAIKKDSDAGKTDLLERYDAAYVKRLEDERGPITVEQYAELVVASERGELPAALRKLSLPPGCLLRIERVWIDKTAGSMALAASVEEAIDALRDA